MRKPAVLFSLLLALCASPAMFGIVGGSADTIHMAIGAVIPTDVSCLATGTLIAPSWVLTAGTQYYWKVTAIDARGLETESSAWSFTTK